MPTLFGSWQQFPGEGFLGNLNYSLQIYSGRQHSVHAHSNVFNFGFWP